MANATIPTLPRGVPAYVAAFDLTSIAVTRDGRAPRRKAANGLRASSLKLFSTEFSTFPSDLFWSVSLVGKSYPGYIAGWASVTEGSIAAPAC